MSKEPGRHGEGVLSRALMLLEESGWTQEWWALDEKGGHVGTFDKAAVSFCVRSAIYRAAAEINAPEYGIVAELTLAGQLDSPSVVRWADDPERTFSEVREVFRRAIAEAEFASRRVAA